MLNHEVIFGKFFAEWTSLFSLYPANRFYYANAAFLCGKEVNFDPCTRIIGLLQLYSCNLIFYFNCKCILYQINSIRWYESQTIFEELNIENFKIYLFCCWCLQNFVFKYLIIDFFLRRFSLDLILTFIGKMYLEPFFFSFIYIFL